MTGSKANARVVIVGAGPVGMVCALALNRRGVPVTVFEQEPAPVEDQRAASLHPSTLEMLDTLGITEKIIPLGLVSSAYRFHDRVSHSGVARGQRGRKAQPGGMRARSGGWPSIGMRRRPVTWSRRGIEARRPEV